jgi:TRAP-type uncharacterized transport system fused permease subunit
VRAGLHFLMPIGVLIWCLMVEEMSPALSAFWAIATLIVLMLTQRPLIALRGCSRAGAWREGLSRRGARAHDGARNMIGIGVATATAGIIVGGITLTGLGLRMTEFVEFVSQGNVIAMLLFIAFVCLVLGLGVPTTANYVLVATLMAPVVVELGAQSGLVIPLIAVHLFVFYYGIMGDITPPVGLATFAAAAISGEDAIQTGIQGALYALRTVILPFIWIFNPQLLLIDDRQRLGRAAAGGVGLHAGDAGVRGADDELVPRPHAAGGNSALLALAVVLLFRPTFLHGSLAPEYARRPPRRCTTGARRCPTAARLVMVISGHHARGRRRPSRPWPCSWARRRRTAASAWPTPA